MDVICPRCRTNYQNLPAGYANRNFRCKKCNFRFTADQFSEPQETQLAPTPEFSDRTSEPQETQLTSSAAVNNEDSEQASHIDSLKSQKKSSAQTSKISEIFGVGTENFLSVQSSLEQSVNDWRIGDVLLELYEVKAVLGEGQFGKVFQVRHRGWNLDLALKTPKLRALSAGSDNIEKEAETWVNLDLHPNIVNCYYVRRIAGIPQIFSEYVDGGDVKTLITSKQLYLGDEKKALLRIMDIAIQFAWGLHYAHEQGLIHQDIKPANIMITSDGIIKVTDFGLAKAGALANFTGQENNQTMVIAGMGMTPAYASPEQLAGRHLTRRTDLWSWAVCVLEMILGYCQWESGTVAPEILNAYTDNNLDETPALTTIPEAMTRLIAKCFQEAEEDRPKTLYDVAESLIVIYRDETGTEYFRQRPQEGSETASSQNNQAISLLDLGKTDEAVRLWESALNTDPQHFETTYNTLLYRWKSEGLEESELLAKIISTAKGRLSERIRHALAKLYIQFGFYNKAISILNNDQEKFVQPDPGLSNEACKELGLALCAKYRLAKGFKHVEDSHWGRIVKCLKKAIANKATDPYTCTAYLLALQRYGDKEEAAKFFKVASKIDTIPKKLKQAVALFLPGYEVLYRLAQKNIKAIQFFQGGEKILFSQGKKLIIWNLSEETIVNEIEGHISNITAIAVCPEIDSETNSEVPRYIISGSEHGDVRVWDYASGAAVKVWSAHDSQINALQVTSCGNFLITASDEKRLCLWDIDKASRVGSFYGEGHDSGAVDIHVSPAGKQIVSAGNDKIVRIWDAVSGHSEKILSGHDMAVTCVVWINDTHVLSGSFDKTIRLWHTISGECSRVFNGHNGKINVLRVVINNKFFLSGSSDGSVRFWDLNTGTSYILSQFVSPVLNIALDDSGQFAFIVTRSGISLIETCNPFRYQASYLFSLPESAIEIDQLHRDYEQKLSTALSAYSKRDYLLAMQKISEAREIKGYKRDHIAFQRWSELYSVLPKLKLKNVWKLAEFREYESRIISLAVAPVSNKLYFANKLRSIYQLDIETGQIIDIYPTFKHEISMLKVTSDGSGILVAYGENIQFLDCQTGQKLSLFCNHTGRVSALTITADGRFALSADENGAFYLWRLLTGELMANFSYFSYKKYDKNNVINTVAVTPDGRFALTGNRCNYFISIWDMETGKIVTELEEHENIVTSVVVTSDGRNILSGSADGTLRLWQVHSSRKKSVRIMKGHSKRINQVAIDYQGKLAISVSDDKTVRLWDVISGECLHVFDNLYFSFTSTAFSMDGHYAFAGNADGSIMVWCLDWLLRKNIPHNWDTGADIYLHNHLSTRTVMEPQKELNNVLQILKFCGYGWLEKDQVAYKLVELSQSHQSKILPAGKFSRATAKEKQPQRKNYLLYFIMSLVLIVLFFSLTTKDDVFKIDSRNNAIESIDDMTSVKALDLTNETEIITVSTMLDIAESLAGINTTILLVDGQLDVDSLKVPVDINELNSVVSNQEITLTDGWGQSFIYQGIRRGILKGRISLRSAGRDQKFKTEDDLVLNGYPYWDSLEVRKNNQIVVKLSTEREIAVERSQEESAQGMAETVAGSENLEAHDEGAVQELEGVEIKVRRRILIE